MMFRKLIIEQAARVLIGMMTVLIVACVSPSERRGNSLAMSVETSYAQERQEKHDIMPPLNNASTNLREVNGIEQITDMEPMESQVLNSPKEGNVYWQARMNDSCDVNLRLEFENPGGGEPAVVRLNAAYVSRRNRIDRHRIQCEQLKCVFEGNAPLSFSFSTEFEYLGVSYRVRGHFTAGDENSGHSSVQCVPLTLSRESLQEGEYGDIAR